MPRPEFYTSPLDLQQLSCHGARRFRPCDITVHGRDAQAPCAIDVARLVVDEDHPFGLQGQGLQTAQVGLRVGLQYAGVGGVIYALEGPQ